MSEQRFVCIDIGYGDDWYITDNGKKLSEMEIVDCLNEQQSTITHLEEECKEKLDTFDKAEIEAINIIYEEKGFDGIIEYSRQKLYNYGVVKEKNGLVMMATGGWSDNEDYLYCLNHLLSNFGRNHYVGYLRGGAFYYSKDKYNVGTEIVVLMKHREEVGKLVDRIDEQQATIRRLQDLCGESDSENAKLRIENKKFKEENEQLRQELNGKDCRKCGNYCRDKALDYCLVDEREPFYFSFPFRWDYKAEAEKCKYYYR